MSTGVDFLNAVRAGDTPVLLIRAERSNHNLRE